MSTSTRTDDSVAAPPPPAPSPAAAKCFNLECGDIVSKKGWRLRSGDHADLCDRCASAYDNGRFCDTFHLRAAGWRSCESCGKRVHCGCIVSLRSYIHLDLGGIECLSCDEKNTASKSNNGLPDCKISRMLMPERVKDSCVSSSSLGMDLNLREVDEVSRCERFTGDFIGKESSEKACGKTMSELRRNGDSVDDPRTFLRFGNRSSPSSSQSKQLPIDYRSGCFSVVENQIRNGKFRADSREKNQLLPRNLPGFCAGENNPSFTPLFEKMLSASDAGRIGRLVLPKKCAEAYFPSISQPEGLPLEIRDSNGKEWVFQFRFWPNNNSRMYVLEGVTPCIQNMKLQAGDTVTFSRMEPHGKLVMGCRKASGIPSSKQVRSYEHVQQAETTDPQPRPKSEVRDSKIHSKKRKKKRTADLKLTWEEAQGMLRPPSTCVPCIVIIEDFEFEEYEDAPVLGKPTVFATDYAGDESQWVECESCRKWRKVPPRAPIPFKWTCSANPWDPARSSCSASQELTVEKFLSPDIQNAQTSGLEGLDTLANLAVLSQSTTRHPRHRAGCSCIVCIQPPSGRGTKHRPSCSCNVCLSVKRRFRTLKMKRQKKQETDSEVVPVTSTSVDERFRSLKCQIDLNIPPEFDD